MTNLDEILSWLEAYEDLSGYSPIDFVKFGIRLVKKYGDITYDENESSNQKNFQETVSLHGSAIIQSFSGKLTLNAKLSNTVYNYENLSSLLLSDNKYYVLVKKVEYNSDSECNENIIIAKAIINKLYNLADLDYILAFGCELSLTLDIYELSSEEGESI